MKKTKTPLAILLLLLVFTTVQAQGQMDKMKMVTVKLISAVDVEEKIDGKAARASTVEVILQPAEEGAPHRHPGPVYGYVLEGTYDFKVEGKPRRTLKAGDTFYEPIMALHQVSANPSESAITRVLAVVVHPRDAKRLVIPEN